MANYKLALKHHLIQEEIRDAKKPGAPATKRDAEQRKRGYRPPAPVDRYSPKLQAQTARRSNLPKKIPQQRGRRAL